MMAWWEFTDSIEVDHRHITNLLKMMLFERKGLKQLYVKRNLYSHLRPWVFIFNFFIVDMGIYLYLGILRS